MFWSWQSGRCLLVQYDAMERLDHFHMPSADISMHDARGGFYGTEKAEARAGNHVCARVEAAGRDGGGGGQRAGGYTQRWILTHD